MWVLCGYGMKPNGQPEPYNLDMSTVDRVLTELEKTGALKRQHRPFKQSIFWVTWENTLLGNAGANYLHAHQNTIWGH